MMHDVFLISILSFLPGAGKQLEEARRKKERKKERKIERKIERKEVRKQERKSPIWCVLAPLGRSRFLDSIVRIRSRIHMHAYTHVFFSPLRL
mmetsp:Transcript_53922/g.105458  ORF Transcript_53922/g.105458 Transcript_53922/m.105458 type:complete len:93 (+) Transcript_53922:1136-1414(+)